LITLNKFHHFVNISALENKLITKICENVSEVYTRKDVVSPSPESEIANEVTNSQLPTTTSLPTEGIRYPVSKQVTVIKCF